MTGQGPLAPGVVQVRLNGDQDDAAALAGVLAAVPGLEVLPARTAPTPTGASPGTGSTSPCGSPPRPPPNRRHPDDHQRTTTRDPELAADPDYRQAAAEDWWGRVADYYADQQAEADEEALCLAAQWDPDARQAYLEQYGVQIHDPEPGPAPAQGASSAPPSSTAALQAAEPTEPEAGP